MNVNVCADTSHDAKMRNRMPPPFDLSKPGRLRIEQLLFLLGVSRTTFYRHRDEGLIPSPDGYDLKNRPKNKQGRPYWFTETILPLVQARGG